MKRSVVGFDRVVVLLAGLVLLAVGAATAAWGAGRLDEVWTAAPQELQLKTATDAFAASWWPWAAGAAGVVFVLLALWWLAAHVPRRGAGTVSLPGTSRTGRLLIDPSAPAAVAAEVLAEAPGVRSSRGRVVRDRGRLVVELKATVEPDADLTAVVAATDAVTGDLAHVLGRDDARARVHLVVARSARHERRVH